MTARRATAPDGMTVAEDAQAVFRAAIRAGLLSERPADRNWAGHYFYIFHDGNGAAWFKHRVSRTHVTLAACRTGAPA